MIAELRRSVEGIGFDETPMPDLTLEDIDLAATQRLFGESRQLDEKTLLTLKLVNTYQGRLVPTRGAVLLFGKQRLTHFPDAWIQCGRFLGTEKIDIFDHIEIDAPLPKAVDEVMLFLKKHAFRGADLSGIRRQDVWSIPLSILREVVINALVHADYSQRGAPVRAVFLDDRIEVENPGLLLPGLTIEDMKQGTSKIRNTVIARVFRELNLIEQWGTGVRRIFREAIAQGLPEPQIVEAGMRLKFILPLAASIHVQEQTTSDAGEQVSEQVGEQVSILLVSCEQERTKKELLVAAGLSPAYLNYKRHIVPLLEKGWLEMTIPDKPNSRLQKYRLTDKGRRGLALEEREKR